MKLLYGNSIEDIFLKHKEDFLKVVASENIKPITHSQLVLRFHDLNGKAYYGFPKETMLPLERHGKLMQYMQYISKGLTAEEDKQIDDAIADIALHEKEDRKLRVRIAGLLSEKERRRSLCIHTELFYNYIAVQLVREDEPVEIFDNDIQMQKVSQFKEEAKKKGSTYHFFQQPEFKKLNDMLRLSESEWQQLWQESLNQQGILKEILEVYSSGIISTTPQKNGKAN